MAKIILTQEQIDTITEYLEDEGLNITIRDDYSGRGMFSARCFAIVTDESAFSLGAAFGKLAQTEEDTDGIFGYFTEYPPAVDNMGRSSVYYWPKISCKPLDE